MSEVWTRQVRVWLTARQKLLPEEARTEPNPLFFLIYDYGTELA